jgi:hypothetical protein
MASHGVTLPADSEPVSANPLLVNTLILYIGPIRDIGRLRDAQARLAVERGDAEALTQAVEDMFNLASFASEPDVIITHLVRIAVLLMATERIGETIVRHPELIDEATAAHFDGLIADALDQRWTELDPVTELTVFEDIIRRMVDNRGVFNPTLVGQVMPAVDLGNSLPSPPPSTAPLTAFTPDLVASYRELERYVAAGVQATQPPWRPYPISHGEMDSWSKHRDSVPGRIGRLLLGILNADWSKVASTFRTAGHEVLGLRVALAAHRHQLRHGAAPASLDAIDADLLTFDPVDGFTGGRLVYRWTGEGHLVYAFGADLDDDGGRPAVDPDGTAVRTITDEYLRGKWDGDWVVFPPRE